MEIVAIILIAAALGLTIEGLSHVVFWAEKRYGILITWIALTVFCLIFWSITLCILVKQFSIPLPRL
jgi:hypothetical protein